MAEDPTTSGEPAAAETQDAQEADATVRLIDALMSTPPKGLPSIVVVGDDAVFGINPARRPPA